MNRTILALLGASLLLAGCASPKTTEPTTPAGNGSVQSAAVAAPTTALAAAAPNVSVKVPYAFDGKDPAYAEACAFTLVTFQCADAPPGADFSKVKDSPKLPGAPSAATITATWTSTAPTNDAMTLTAYSFDGKGSFKSYGFVSGRSPLKLEPKSISVPAGDKLVVGLFPQDAVSSFNGPAGGRVGGTPVEQAYHLEGSWTVQLSSSGT